MENKEKLALKKDSGATLREHQSALMSLLCELDRVCRALDVPYVLYSGSMLGAVRHKGFIPWDDDLDILMMRKDYEKFLLGANELLDGKKFFLQKEFSAHWPMFFSKLRLNGTTCLEKYHPKDEEAHGGVYIDIFPCDNAYRTSFGRKIQFLSSKVVIAKALSARGYETDSLSKKLFMGACKLFPRALFLRVVKGGKTHSKYVHTFLAAASSYSKNVLLRESLEKKKRVQFETGEYPIPEKFDEILSLLYGDYMRLPSEEERAVKKHAVLVDLEKDYREYREQHKAMQFDIHTRSIR